jgi:cysteine synthase A
MHARGEAGSIVSLLCDRGERYDRTLFDPQWLSRSGIDPAPWTQRLHATTHGDGTQAPVVATQSAAASLAGTAAPGSSNSRA